MNTTLIITILLVEVFAIGISFFGSWFIGSANREDRELRLMRKIFGITLFASLNILIFLN